MRFTVQYIPVSQIKPGSPSKINERLKQLRKVASDCMHLMIVRKNRKEKNYTLVSGNRQYEFFIKHTKKSAVPCLVDESKAAKSLSSVIDRFRKRKLPYDIPHLNPDRFSVASWSIIRAFLKQEPRFAKLSRRQQLRVLSMGIRYKKTTLASMRRQVQEYVTEQK